MLTTKEQNKKVLQKIWEFDWSTGQLKTRGGEWVDVGMNQIKLFLKFFKNMH